MGIQLNTVLGKFSDLLTLEKGSPDLSVSGMKDPAHAGPEDLIFIFSPKHLKAATESQSRIWIISKELVPATLPQNISALISSPNPQLAMARIARHFFRDTSHFQPIQGSAIHPAAQVSSTARLGMRCIIGPGAVISDHCELGDDCVVGANAVIEPHVKLGARTHIHPLVFIGHHCETGTDCEIKPHTTIGTEGFGYAYDSQFKAERITHFGRVVLGDRVHIGAGVQIDRGTFLDSRIGADTKIDNHCHFAHNIEIGRNTIIAGAVIAAGSVKIGDYCVIGGRSTINGHLEIVSRTKIAGASAITKSILVSGEYGGFPLQEVNLALKTRAVIPRLPEMRRQLMEVMKRLGLNEEGKE